jgi:hypothetical protein
MKQLQFILLLFLTLNLSAQQTKDETIFGDVNRIGAFGGPLFEFSDFGDNPNTAVGGAGALILDDFFLGGYGMGGIDFSDIETDGSTTQSIQDLDFGHGGLWLGITPKQEKAIHPFGAVKLGWGSVNYEVVTDLGSGNEETNDVKDRVFVVTPEAGVEFNIFDFFRVATTVNYRLVDGLDRNLNGFEDKDFSKLGATLTLRFGGFGNYWWD